MVERTNPYTVGTTAVMLAAVNPRRTSLGIANLSSTLTLYVGTTNQVLTTSGFPIGPGQTQWLNSGFGDEPNIAYYGITTAASADIRVIEQYGPLRGV